MKVLKKQSISHRWKPYIFVVAVFIQVMLPTLIAALFGVYAVGVLILLSVIHACIAGWLLYSQYQVHCQEQALQEYFPLNLENAKHRLVFEFIRNLSDAIGLQTPTLVIKKTNKMLPELLAESAMLPNYTIIINEDLLTVHGKGLDDEQLKLILAHEVGHLVYKDQLRQWLLNGLQCLFIIQSVTMIVSSLFLLNALSFFFLTGLLLFIGGIQLGLIRKHARFCELEADRFAATLCNNPSKMLQIFDELPMLYHYWGMLYLEDSFEQPRLYSDYQIAPLLEKLHYYKTSLRLSPDSTKIKEIVLQLNSCCPVSFNNESCESTILKRNFYQRCMGFFNAYPSRAQRMVNLADMCKQTNTLPLSKSGKYSQI
ncbi:M48 family metalloprotease [Candidatus Berkiella cookevillensis]|uniref:M48 family metalloprotease n=1 Tax=Candidatus Berkiella cookevillensis TaxID=437022 RepID=A0A0Q9YFF4_9GAMM|nr:M48 family metalloprotease [Candidatus Berkiella cookevillensis]MCS5708154.1 M48 family metalloprotease [Candidatus Berkiella cookevillensis]